MNKQGVIEQKQRFILSTQKEIQVIESVNIGDLFQCGLPNNGHYVCAIEAFNLESIRMVILASESENHRQQERKGYRTRTNTESADYHSLTLQYFRVKPEDLPTFLGLPVINPEMEKYIRKVTKKFASTK